MIMDIKSNIMEKGFESTNYSNTNYINALWILVVAMFFVSIISISIASAISNDINAYKYRINQLDSLNLELKAQNEMLNNNLANQ